MCIFIAIPGGRIIEKKFPKIIPVDNLCDLDKISIIDAILLAILFFILPPFLLAIAKYKDKSYKERYYLLWRDYWKPFVCLVLSWLFFRLLMGPYDELFEKNNTDVDKNDNDNLTNYQNNTYNDYDYNNDDQ